MLKIDMYGDSTMYGYIVNNGVAGQLTTPIPQQVGVLLNAALGDGAVEVSNYGANASYAKALVDGTPPFGDKYSNYLNLAVNLPTKIVVMNFGMNDVTGQSDQAYHDTMTTLVLMTRAAGKVIVFQEPNPCTDPNRANLPQIVAQMYQVAMELNVPIVHTYSLITQGVANWQAELSDILHPGQTLALWIAQQVTDTLLPIVKSLQTS